MSAIVICLVLLMCTEIMCGVVMSVRVVILDYLCRLKVQVYVYCARRIHSHLRCTQCSIMLHLMDICFLPCIYLWPILQIQTCL